MAMESRVHSSSSMASAQPNCYSYDVFVSFRGKDTRKSFTDHLNTALNQAGVRTFRDDDAMERGKLLKPELDKAIQESAISLIVFSKRYASSKWCLNEVLMIMKEHETSSSKHEVLPVFYKVDPSDVRNQTGSFKKAFDAYDDKVNAETDLEKKRGLLEKVRAWRDSLNKAASFTGLVYKDGYESEFIIDIVNVIRKKLDYKTLYIDEKLVGLKDHVGEIESWLQDPSPNATILLIDGMGGIGKTTIAKCIFNSNSCNYDASCFLANINDTSEQPGGLLRLQSQLLSTILKSDKEETIWNDYEGTVKIAKAISNKHVFLILDDVATSEQLDVLLGPKRFYAGSKVIITTRHKELSTAFTVHHKVHSVGTLCGADAIELFCLYAFDQDLPIEPYIHQSEVFVRYCTGLPLGLKVLGSSLRGKTIAEWEDTMCQLAGSPDPVIQEVLEISYKTLKHDTDKELFLHIACFFQNWKKDSIVKLLCKCNLYPVVGIKNLMDRCLLDVDERGRVVMHQLIKEMGRKVVGKESEKEPGKRSRLWHHQDCIDVLQDQSGTKKVEGLMFDIPEMKEAKSAHRFKNSFGKRMRGNNANFEIGALEKMKNLMLLQLNYATFSGKSKKLPRKLRLLRWHGCTLKAIPSDFSLEKLVVLDMRHSKLKRVWDDYRFLRSLKYLNLSYSVKLIRTPDFRGLPSLETLILRGCSSLIKVDESIAYLKELVLLDLTGCTKLREFPCFPTSLISLQMSGCRVFGLIQSMNSLPSFSLLRKMNLSFCNLVDDSFPNEWSSLVALEHLDISGNNVTFLPKCIQTIPSIQFLSVKRCSNIQSIIGLPESLTSLDVNFNESLEKVYVQVTQNRLILVSHIICEKLCEIEGLYKIQSIDKVERKIVQYLGLKVNEDEGMELGLKVMHEFGIFSTVVPGKLIPSGFMYEERGPHISFNVPWHYDNLRISAFNLCVVLPQPSGYYPVVLMTEVYNKTKGLFWRYECVAGFPKNTENNVWLSLWRCGNLLEAGDEISIHIPLALVATPNYYDIHDRVDPKFLTLLVEECRINLLYGVDDELNEEIKEARDVSAFDQISWTDRMATNISDYVYSGSMHEFSSSLYGPQEIIKTPTGYQTMYNVNIVLPDLSYLRKVIMPTIPHIKFPSIIYM